MSKVIDALNCKCPNCEKGKIFMNGGNILLFNIPKMNDRCLECDYKFEREPGFFFGAMFVSYALAAAQMIISLVVFWYFIDLSPLGFSIRFAFTKPTKHTPTLTNKPALYGFP